MQKALFVQFANSFFKRHASCDEYLTAFYKVYHDIGYYAPKNTLELPKWISEVCYTLGDGFKKDLFWCYNNTDEVVDKIHANQYDYVLFSLMNSNKNAICDIISKCPDQFFLVGGYDSPFMETMSERFQNLSICDSVECFASKIGVEYKFGTDYSLFAGESTIPRLTMSYGCLHKCDFCIVPHGKITCVDDNVIKQQVESFKPLDYRLIYIDDKTFGQAANYKTLPRLAETTGKADFNGFIVQTTSGMLVRKGMEFSDIGVRVAEIGLESFNDSILRKYHKPSSEKAFMKAVQSAEDNGIDLIANIIIGLPEEDDKTYRRTFDAVMPLLEEGKLIGINAAIYTDYTNEENLGEIDFQESANIDMHRAWWDKFNGEATRIVRDKQK